jgi:hypothetical protein
MTSKFSKQEIEEAKEALRERLKPGDKVYTLMVSRSRSGMSRRIRLFIFKDSEREDITFWVARAIQWPINDDHELRVDGTGMDMGFHTVYTLSHALFPDGFECIGEDKAKHWTKNCPSNEHNNGDRNYKPHHHSSGGYALRHEWL